MLELDSKRVKYETPDNKKAWFSLDTISSASPDDSCAFPAISIEFGKGKRKVFEIETAAAKRDRDTFLASLRKALTVAKEGKSHVAEEVPIQVEEQVAPTKKVLTEAEKRAQALSSDALLRDMYQTLVLGGVVTDEEFWMNAKIRDKFGLEASGGDQDKQQIGIGSGISTDLAPVIDDEEVEFRMTPSLIHDIFSHNPDVYQAYLDNVPEKMSEEMFWQNYWRSKYFYRKQESNKKKQIQAAEEVDMFKQYAEAQKDEEGRKKPKVVRPLTKSLRSDVSLLKDDWIVNDMTERLVPETQRSLAKTVIENLHQHSHFVLQTCVNEEIEKDIQLHAGLEDLDEDVEEQFNRLNISSLEPKTKSSSFSQQQLNGFRNQMLSAFHEFENRSDFSTCLHHKPNLSQLESLYSRYSAQNRADLVQLQVKSGESLGDLYIFDSGNGKNNLEIPDQIAKRLKPYITKGYELLSHFWKFVPPQDPDSIQKVVRMGSILEQHSIDLIQRREKILQNPPIAPIGALFSQVLCALDKAIAISKTISSKSHGASGVAPVRSVPKRARKV